MADQESGLTKKEKRALKKQRKQEQTQEEKRQAQQKQWIIYAALGLVVLVGGYFIFNSIVTIPEQEKHKPVEVVLADDWAKGESTAPVVIIGYSDFQCPACANYGDILDELLKTYAGQVKVVYRHFPISQSHPQANLAAQAAEAAGEQGYFWEMHDLIFANQDEWSDGRGTKGKLIGYAEQIEGLDVSQFRKDINSKKIKARVKADYMSALSYNLTSTPAFFMNGERVDNPESLAGFVELIEERFEVVDETEAAASE